MSECHATHCAEPATLRLRFMNNFTFKNRPTSPLDYCDQHGNALAEKWSERGMRVLIDDLTEGQR